MQAEITEDGVIDDTAPDVDEKSIDSEEIRAREFAAVMILWAGLFVGVIGNVLFYRTPLGVNAPLLTLVFLVAAGALVVFFQLKTERRNLVLVVPALVFAVFLSVRASPGLVFLNATAAAGCLFLALRFARVPRFLGGKLFLLFYALMEGVFVAWLEPFVILTLSSGWFKRLQLSNDQAARVGQVIRGLMLTFMVVLVFGALLASADRVFGDMVNGLFSILSPGSFANAMTQISIIGMFAWLSMIGFKLLVIGTSVADMDQPEDEKKKVGFRLTMIESGMILISVNLMFLVFMLIQARYLFGGEANITAQGYTYAEYARRGFEELLLVSAMTMALILTLDSITVGRQERFFKGLALALVGLTLLLLLAAFFRLDLYENAYGYTRIRVMSGVFMLWLAVLFGFVVWDLLWRDRRLFGIGCVVASAGFLLTLNVMNMDGFIASRNIERFEETGRLDVIYLLTLSDDALPVVAQLVGDPRLSEEDRSRLSRSLGWALYDLDRARESWGLFGYHFGKERAWSVLDPHRDALEVQRRPSSYSRWLGY